MSSTKTIHNFGFLCTFVLLGILTVIRDTHGNILCSTCDSRRDNYYGECEQYPPNPTPCANTGKQVYCLIAREIDSKGIQLLFARGCTTIYRDEGCYVRNITIGLSFRQKTVCVRTCDTTGCNTESLLPRGASSRLKPHHSRIFSIFLFGFTIVYINSCYQLLTDPIN